MKKLNPEEESEFLHHTRCPTCGSSDANAVYDDGHTYCFSCGASTRGDGSAPRKEPRITKSNKDITPLFETFRAIPKRGLTEESIEKYGIGVNMDKDKNIAHVYPYFKDGHHVANKIRTRETKDFYSEGDIKAELFGQHLFPPASAKAITIVEGELDAASAYQLTGSRYPVVSVTNAGAAIRDVKRNYEYLNSFDKIVVCFDKDEAKVKPDGTEFFPGQENALAVAQLFEPGKVAIMTLQQGKDPSEYLSKGIAPQDFVREWYNAPVSRPDGIRAGSEMWDDIISERASFSIPYPWDGVQRATYGMRLGEAVLLMADTGLGKTKFFHTLALQVLNDETAIENGMGVGMLMLEEPNRDTAIHLMGTHVGKPFHLPDTERTEEELRRVYDEIINTERLLFYDHFGSNDIDTILNKIRHMAVMGCKYIFVDHLSIIVSAQNGDERKDLDEISTKLKMLTVELDIAVLCIIHTNRNGEARGSAGPEKVANVHILIERDKEDPDPIRRNITRVTVKKCRLTGRTGPVSWVYYDASTHQLMELDADAAHKYEEGMPMTQGDLPWQT